MTRRKTSWALRFVAACCLLALVGTWLPHVHEGHYAAEAADGSSGLFDSPGFTLSSDDAHAEHSSVRENEGTACVLCRSKARRDEARVSTIDRAFADATRGAAYLDPVIRRTHALCARLHPARAPPVAQPA